MKDLKLKGINKEKIPTSKVANFRLKLTTIENLKKLANANNTSMNKVIEFLINEKVS